MGFRTKEQQGKHENWQTGTQRKNDHEAIKLKKKPTENYASALTSLHYIENFHFKIYFDIKLYA